jgi:hypothetical protein
VNDDLSRLFSQLRDQPIPEDRLDELTARLDQQIAQEAEEIVTGSRFQWHRVASIAASLLLAALISIPLSTYETAEPVAMHRFERTESLEALVPTGAVEAMALPEISGIEFISSPGDAQTLDIELGDARVLMIFDESINL